LEALYNKQLCHAKVVIENNFGNLKKTFHELMSKSNLHLKFLHDVVVCCCLLHNMIMSRKHMNIDELMLATFKDGKDIRNSYTW
jgi:hypothetical protein